MNEIQARERRLKAADLRDKGLKFREIGERMGVSAGRARELCNRGKVEQSHAKDWDYQLMVNIRARWTIQYDMGISSKEELEAAVKEGRLAPGKKRGYGEKTHAVVLEFLNQDATKEVIK